jgi:hypothetical protein
MLGERWERYDDEDDDEDLVDLLDRLPEPSLAEQQRIIASARADAERYLATLEAALDRERGVSSHSVRPVFGARCDPKLGAHSE